MTWLEVPDSGTAHAEVLAAAWADRIRPHLEAAVGSIVAAGRELNAAKEALSMLCDLVITRTS